MKDNIFQDTSQAGLYQYAEKDRDLILSNALAAKLKVLTADIGNCKDSHGLLAEIGRTLSFPDWYGANFDALHDCLTDPDWQPAPGHLILISGLPPQLRMNPDELCTLLEVFRSAIEIRKELTIPLWILVDLPIPDITPMPA